jgi:hypothetical protein
MTARVFDRGRSVSKSRFAAVFAEYNSTSFGTQSAAFTAPTCRAGNLICSRVSFLMFVCDYPRRTRPWVQIAKPAITGEHVRDAFFYRAVLAVPVHGACPDVYYCAPRGIAKSFAWRSSKRRCRCKSSDTKCQFRKGFLRDESSSSFLCLLK